MSWPKGMSWPGFGKEAATIAATVASQLDDDSYYQRLLEDIIVAMQQAYARGRLDERAEWARLADSGK